ncbi:MAG: hypothetical protein V2J07_00075 [Anaerolineae bacterium]|jgi:hypothetical protein|nr:hypothetical protein [Anaerolineae bacterium]
MRTWTKTTLRILILITTIFLVGMRPIAENEVKLTDPSDGDVLRGTISIYGNTDVVGFKSYVLEFAYENGTNETTWFLIAESEEKIANDVLGTWDTLQITDGDYRLRLTVYMDDDKPEYDTVTELKVRNYTPLREDEVSTQEVLPTSALVFEETETTENPEKDGSLWGSMLRGMMYTVLVIVILAAGLWFYTQQNRRKRRQRRN